MEYRIVTDSSANVFSLSGVQLASVPLKIVTAEKEYVDDAALDVDGMIGELQRYNNAMAAWNELFLAWRDWQARGGSAPRRVRALKLV